ncbi:hypothetical protein KVR01_004856 [Diaporthe batatas]|uniref:uncharacterized protein n=1 Tax=Diaporthe batatas TaxID=748121 RepID=UPI001D05AF4B|nr:uncharacterized protein KVR01_004856 [Diaporthe batatas]KAG8164581.1 hypothetical protein KVR01_004856 [Diaporthe batatas]
MAKSTSASCGSSQEEGLFRLPAVDCISGTDPSPSSGLLREGECTIPVKLTEIRAAQRTFEGAYMRTALSQFSFALIILKIFTSEFYAIGALFAAYGVAVLVVAIFRRYEGNKQFFDQEESDSESDDGEVGEHMPGQDGGASPRGRRRVQMIRKKFRTSGNSVTLLTFLSLGAYITLLVLTLRLSS